MKLPKDMHSLAMGLAELARIVRDTKNETNLYQQLSHFIQDAHRLAEEIGEGDDKSGISVSKGGSIRFEA